MAENDPKLCYALKASMQSSVEGEVFVHAPIFHVAYLICGRQNPKHHVLDPYKMMSPHHIAKQRNSDNTVG